MEPITLIVAALTLGIAAGLKPTAEQAVKDAYSDLRELIKRRYGVGLDGLEKKPDSAAQQAAVQETLTDAGAEQDADLLAQAKALIDQVNRADPDSAAAVGLDIEAVEAAFLRARRIAASGGGTAARIKDSTFSGGIELEDISADSETPDPKA